MDCGVLPGTRPEVKEATVSPKALATGVVEANLSTTSGAPKDLPVQVLELLSRFSRVAVVLNWAHVISGLVKDGALRPAACPAVEPGLGQ